MEWWETLLIAVGLAMDAAAVAICKGSSMRQAGWRHGLTLGLVFGGFQAAMPLAGYVLGDLLAGFVASFDHWIAFGLLAFIGIRMALDSIRGGGKTCSPSFAIGELLALGLATSIDAFAVGVSLAFLGGGILLEAILIGAVTFGISLFAFHLGRKAGALLHHAGLAGGVVLVFLGVRILFTHLGIW